MSPATAVNAFCTTEHDQVKDRTINYVCMIPVVDTSTHDDHGATFCLFCVVCKFTSCTNHYVCFYASDFFLPCWCIWSVLFVASSHFTAQTTVNTIVSKNQVKYCCYLYRAFFCLYCHDRNSTFNNTFMFFVTEVR